MNGSQHRQPNMSMTTPTTKWEGPTTPLEAALLYAGLGLCVLPITPGKKHPPIPGWQDAATTDRDTIESWWTGLYRGHGVGIATGPRSGIWVLDIDVADGKQGRESLLALESQYGKLPYTPAAVTGSGGRHVLFKWDPDRPITNGMATNLPPGLDIRGEGGQIVVPPTTHPNGQSYEWMSSRAPWAAPTNSGPDWLYGLLLPPGSKEQPATPVTPPATSVGDDSDDSAAAWIRAQHNWRDLLNHDGWTEMYTRGDDTYWCRPGKNPRDGHSAIQHGDGALVIFTSEIPYGLAHAGRPTKDGGFHSFSIFGYIAGTRYGGDRSACARDARMALNALNRPATGLTPPAPTGATGAPQEGAEEASLDGMWDPTLGPSWHDAVHREVLRLKVKAEAKRVYDLDYRHAPPTDGQILTGGALFDMPPGIPAVWGYGDEVLWAQGEPFLLAAPPGVGKTTLMGQVVAGLIGIERYATVLGWPVTPCQRVLYFASDRPRQIIRSLRRHFTAADQELLDERLHIWRGPPPVDFAQHPEALVEACDKVGADVVILDSIKDMAVGISKDEVGAGLNRAIQLAIAEGVDVAGLHHQRKGQNGEKPRTLEDVYGSVWITAGAGSVVLLWGQAGDPLVELAHLKQPADNVGPIKVEHDHPAGVSRLHEGFDPLAYLRNRKATGATATDMAKAWFEKSKPTDAERMKAKRKLDALVSAGLARVSQGSSRGGDGGGSGALYVFGGPVDELEDRF